jgi:hypothetical protein
MLRAEEAIIAAHPKSSPSRPPARPGNSPAAHERRSALRSGGSTAVARATLAAAVANGRKGGRPRKVDNANAAKARTMRDKGITATDIAKM